MFFCDSCADKNGWWQSLGRSYGPCEVCKEKALCNEVPSSLLPTSTAPAKPALPLPNAFEETP
jgi:hypothetical protein